MDHTMSHDISWVEGKRRLEADAQARCDNNDTPFFTRPGVSTFPGDAVQVRISKGKTNFTVEIQFFLAQFPGSQNQNQGHPGRNPRE